MGAHDSLPDDVTTLKAMLRAERAARLAAEAEAQTRTLMIEKLKLTIRSCGTSGSDSPRSVEHCWISSSSSWPISRRTRASRDRGAIDGSQEDYGAIIRASQAGASAAAGAFAAGAHCLPARAEPTANNAS
jgi:hypothetical protein